MKKTILDIESLVNQRVLVRVDFNVPQDDQGHITDDTRIQQTLPTLKHLLSNKARIVLVSHLGRPKGEVKEALRLTPVAERLKKLLPGVSVTTVKDVYSPAVEAAVEELQPGQILMLENVRFHPGEEKNDPDLAKQLAGLADVYVNDAFGAAHRAHASTEGIAHIAPIKVAGLLMAKEINALSSIRENPKCPYTAIIGGSKVSSKLNILQSLLGQVNNLVIGGGMVFTFLKAQGHEIGQSLLEADMVETARKLMAEANDKGTCIVLARDIVVGDRFDSGAATRTVSVESIPSDWMGLDIGPESIERISQLIHNSQTIFWNGPMGVFEFDAFAEGTRQTALTLAEWTEEGHCTSVLGGGDTLAAIEKFGIFGGRYSHVSTGGGASLEFLEGAKLPGIEVLEDAPEPVKA